jgi:hypothetical protein
LISSENLKSEINSVFNSYDKSFIFLTETILNESNLLSNNKIDWLSNNNKNNETLPIFLKSLLSLFFKTRFQKL